MNGVEIYPCPNCKKLKANVKTVGGKYTKWQISCGRCGFATQAYVNQHDAETEWNYTFLRKNSTKMDEGEVDENYS